MNFLSFNRVKLSTPAVCSLIKEVFSPGGAATIGVPRTGSLQQTTLARGLECRQEHCRGW